MSRKIRLVVTDIDGTLVRHDKSIAPETIAAVQALRAAGVRLALVSSRPPTGLDVLVEPLGLDTPRAGFNGGLILAPDNRVLHQLQIPEPACRQAVAMIEAAGAEAWVFANGVWYLKNPRAAFVPRERMSISQEGVVVADFAPYLATVEKLMAASPDFDLIARLERDIGAAMGTQATVLRSQNYYLDVTHREANKGQAALTLAQLLGVAPEAMCCLGDMPNDTPMFAVAGLSIAMGNAPDAVKALATHVTGDCDGTGWADAIGQWVLTG